MQKTILILSVVALVAACAHEEIAQNPDKDWEHGLDADLSSSIAPLGPIDSDQGAYNLIRRREKEHSLGSRLTAVELDEIVNNSSQVLASALALPLFKAGVYYGQPRLIEKGCASANRVTHSALRSSGSIDAVIQACAALASGSKQGSDSCSDGAKKLRDAYGLLSQDKGPEAGHAAARAKASSSQRAPSSVYPRTSQKRHIRIPMRTNASASPSASVNGSSGTSEVPVDSQAPSGKSSSLISQPTRSSKRRCSCSVLVLPVQISWPPRSILTLPTTQPNVPLTTSSGPIAHVRSFEGAR